jgi:hypothetical protein
MTTRLTIPRAAHADLALVARNAGSLSLLNGLCVDLSEAASLTKLVEEFAAASHIKINDARRIVTQLIGLQALRNNLGIDARELFSRMTDSLRNDKPKDWTDADLAAWAKNEKEIVAVLDAKHPLALLEKTVRLVYEYQCVLVDVGIVTELRPVFNDEATTVERGIITNTLSIEYRDGGELRKLFLALDSRDIDKLRHACERADRKALALRDALKTLTWPAIVPGDDDD